MRLTVRDLMARQPLEKVVIRSIDLSLYQAEAIVDGRPNLIVDKDGKALRTHNIVQMKEHLAGLTIDSLVLVQQSAYDEMIGQPSREGSNALEVPLNPDSDPLPPWLN